MTQFFTGSDVWTGGFNELTLVFEPNPGSELLSAALAELWALPFLEGCYLHRDREPSQQDRLKFAPELVEHTHLQGLARLPGGHRVACGTCATPGAPGGDYLSFYCPTGALGDAYPVGGFPFDDDDHEGWRLPLDDWLCNIGRQVYERAPYRFGLVGFETDDWFVAVPQADVPAKRYSGFLVPGSDGLTWHARTEA